MFLYVPNIIGYARILLLAVSYCLFPKHLLPFAALYGTSFALDAADGWAARRLGQASRFGEYLDMLTDRMGTLMVIFLGFALPRAPCRSFLLVYAVLDVVSHWLQQVVAARSGAHHKSTTSPFALLNFYYRDKRLMAALCVGAEVFFVAYACGYARGGAPVARGAALASLPLMAGKFAMNALQLASNSIALGNL